LPEVICDTSPIQYLYQIGHLELLVQLAGQVIVPPAVVRELEAGKERGVELPDIFALDWIVVKWPIEKRSLPVNANLGAGESEVLMLGLEIPDAILILDDRRARELAKSLGMVFTGTLGVLLSAKQKGLISEVKPLLEALQHRRFRISPHTFQAVLKLANE